jgi:hypothetical protein
MPDEAANQDHAALFRHRDLPAEQRDTESAIRLWQRKASEVGDSPPLSTFEFTRLTSDWGYRFLISGDEFVDASVFLTFRPTVWVARPPEMQHGDGGAASNPVSAIVQGRV